MPLVLDSIHQAQNKKTGAKECEGHRVFFVSEVLLATSIFFDTVFLASSIFFF